MLQMIERIITMVNKLLPPSCCHVFHFSESLRRAVGVVGLARVHGMTRLDSEVDGELGRFRWRVSRIDSKWPS